MTLRVSKSNRYKVPELLPSKNELAIAAQKYAEAFFSDPEMVEELEKYIAIKRKYAESEKEGEKLAA